MNEAALMERLLRTASNRLVYSGLFPTRTTLAALYRRFR